MYGALAGKELSRIVEPMWLVLARKKAERALLNNLAEAR
jgi:hypothetical protein